MFLRLTFLTLLFVCNGYTYAQDLRVKPDAPVKPVNSDKAEKSRGEDPERGLPSEPNSRESDRESRDVFFRTLNETRSRGAQELSYLLFHESVRKEIGLSEDNAKAAREVLSHTRASAEKLYEQFKAKEIAPETLRVKLLDIMTKGDQDIWQTLGGTSEKSDRLIGLFVQHRHCSAALNKIVAGKIGLDETLRQEIVAKKEAEERKMFEERSRETQSPGDRFRAWEKVQKQIDSLISGMLSLDQRDKLEKLKGEPFKFEEFAYPPGPPGRGRDGGRDRNRRDNRDEKCRDCQKLADDR